MKYIAADGTGSPFDLQKNFADVLIKLQMIRPYDPPKPKSVANTAWGINEFRDGTPYIVANCRTCKPNGLSNAQWVYQGHTPEAASFRHCGIEQKVPADICADYKDRITPDKPVERKQRQPVHQPVF